MPVSIAADGRRLRSERGKWAGEEWIRAWFDLSKMGDGVRGGEKEGEIRRDQEMS